MLLTLINRNTQSYSDSAQNYSQWNEWRIPILVKDNFQYTSEEFQLESIPDEDLAKVSMHMSEQSLREGWENENDTLWASLLKEDRE